MNTIPNTIIKVLTSKLFSEFYEYLKKEASDVNKKILSSKNEVVDMIIDHITRIEQWSQNIPLPGSNQYFNNNSDLFINLDYFDKERRKVFYKYPPRLKLNIHKMYNPYPFNLAVLGEPGAGKTTVLQHICQAIIHDDTFYADTFGFPLVICLRDLDKSVSLINQEDGETIFSRLYSELGIWIDSESLSKNEFNWIKNKIIVRLLNNFNVLLILDGFDEINSLKKKEIIIEEIRFLSLSLTTSFFLISSRTADFDYQISNTKIFEIAPLTQEQIKKYIELRFKKEEDANEVYYQIESSPFFDTTVRPLTIANLCSIYQTEGFIPDKPKTVYKLIVELLLKKWDLSRSIKRKSNYAKFELDRKFDFLSRLAFILTSKYKTSTFSRNTLEETYLDMCNDFDLPEKDAIAVANELESHNGLIVQSGIDKYNFAHKSIHEYLTADYIIRLPQIPLDIELLKNMPNEFAIAVAISSNPSEYFVTLIIDRVCKYKLNFYFLRVFFNRLFIEKPEFNHDCMIGPAVLYISDKIFTDKNVTSTSFFEQVENLRNFVDNNNKIKLSLAKINNYYKQDDVSKTHSINSIRLKKRRNLNNHILKYQFPKTLIVDQYLIDSKDNN